jgi:putative ABC transport system substrate-binding protein
MHTRRTLLTRLAQVGLLAAGLGLGAACDQLPGQAARVPQRIGYMANESPAGRQTQALIAGLGDYGYFPGQNVQMESRFPTDHSHDAEVISDLLRSGVDLLVTGGTASTLAAKQATSTLPIVGISVGQPLASGLVESLARPGDNVTGISLGFEQAGKGLELLRLVVPTLTRVGYLYNPDNAGHVILLDQLNNLAAASGLDIVPAEVRVTTDIDGAFNKVVAGGAEALYWPGILNVENDARVAALASSHRLVSLGSIDSYPMAGGLMSYSTDIIAMWRRGGYYVDRILKGAKPADLPMELPTTFELIVNQATAKALGVTIPEQVAQQVTSWI